MTQRHMTIVGDAARIPVIEPVSIDNCDREPIHVPGAIQPHGALVAFESGTSVIRHASVNLKDWLPTGALPIKGRPLNALLSPESWSRLELAVRSPGVSGVRHQILELQAANGGTSGRRLEGVVHRHRNQCILELEQASAPGTDWMQSLSDIMSTLRSATDLDHLQTLLAVQVKRLTGC